ncbi:hypothetical protein NL676_027094 [Syzygium grande]|nr:hypothetical protein NL676_027094 [Syzygium grande]
MTLPPLTTANDSIADRNTETPLHDPRYHSRPLVQANEHCRCSSSTPLLVRALSLGLLPHLFAVPVGEPRLKEEATTSTDPSFE